MSEAPKQFDDLTAAELYRSALEDFALPVEESDKGKKKVLLAAFAEGGVTWADYLAQHPEVGPEKETKPEAATDLGRAAAPVASEVVEVARPVVQNPDHQYLIKMVRENPLYETRGHRFTKEHPYAVVNAADADYILSREDGFRQATPSELAEYYG